LRTADFESAASTNSAIRAVQQFQAAILHIPGNLSKIERLFSLQNHSRRQLAMNPDAEAVNCPAQIGIS
jgi:hypothetical protein